MRNLISATLLLALGALPAGNARAQPVITTQPVSQTVSLGASVTFSVIATSPNPIGYQWQFNGTAINLATGAALTLGAASASQAGSYTAYVYDIVGGVTSNPATLTLIGTPVISGSLTATAYGQTFPFLYTITAANSPTSFGATGLPPGLSVDTQTGVISGIPATTGVFQVTLAASNSSGTGTAVLTLTLARPPYCFSELNVGPAAGFSSLAGIVGGGPNLFYIADSGHGVVYQFNPSTLAATVWAGTSGVAGSSDGAGTAAKFNNPTGLAIDGSGNVYVADTANSTIRRISNAGVVTTLAGVPGEPGSSDGASATAHFNYPQGVAVDSSGNVYVADTGNSTLRRISPGGNVSTLAGTAGSQGSADGTGSAARFGKPVAIVIDSTGNLNVEDYGAANLLIRKISAGAVVTTAASLPWNSLMGTGAGNLAIDSSDNLYLITNNPYVGPQSTLTEVTPGGGTSSTNLLSTYGYGSLTAVPIGMAFDPSGHIFAAAGTGIYEGVFASGPTIVSQPTIAISVVNIDYPAVETFATISVSADSVPAGVLSYQWFLDGKPVSSGYIPGYFYYPLSGQFLTLINSGTVGTYTVLVTDSSLGGAIMSDGVTLSWASAIYFTSQPANQTAVAGASVTFFATTGGTMFPTYQWSFNGTPIAGATGQRYTIPDTRVSDSGSYAVTVSDMGASITSQGAILTVTSPIVITSQPASQGVVAGASVTFSAATSATVAPTYQWTFNGAPITGATTASYTISGAQVSNSGAYAVTVSDQGNSVTSDPAFLTVTASSGGPSIGAQPQSFTTSSGGTVVLSVTLSSAEAQASAPRPAPSAAPADIYLWYFNGSPLSDGGGVNGSQTPTLVLSGAAAKAGSYACLIENPAGSIVSTPATLNVSQTADIGRLINVSCRAAVGTGPNILIAGFAIGGSGTSGPESILVRASGPALVPFGVTGTLADPKLQLYSTASGGSLLATSIGWGGNSLVANTAASVGAFAWASPSSHDSALLQTMAPGPYTANISGEAGDSGIALAEVYDATPEGTYTPSTPRLVNISARAHVGTGGNVLIAGFVIGGSTSKTVLLRASGPALIPFGVAGTLPDPELRLNDASGTIAANTGWGADPQIAAEAASVGAFSWGASATGDSAILVTLTPGAYTAQVSGAGGDTGVALVEVYEVP